MKMERILIQIPKRLRAQLDVERKRGISAAGLIRHLREQYFKGKRAAQFTLTKEARREIMEDTLSMVPKDTPSIGGARAWTKTLARTGHHGRRTV